MGKKHKKGWRGGALCLLCIMEYKDVQGVQWLEFALKGHLLKTFSLLLFPNWQSALALIKVMGRLD